MLVSHCGEYNYGECTKAQKAHTKFGIRNSRCEIRNTKLWIRNSKYEKHQPGSQSEPVLHRSPCHIVPSSRIRPLATAVVAPLHPALSLASRLMLLMVAPLAYPLSVSSHLCLGLPLFLAPFILPSIVSSSIPPALTSCPK